MEHNSPLKNKILKHVEGAVPRSRLYFILKNVGMWLLAGTSIILGALSVSSLLFRAINAGRALGPKPPPLPDIIVLMPYMWLVLLGAFVYLAYREVRATSRGYKYELWLLVLGVVLASCVLGMVFFATGAGFALDRMASKTLPFHPDLVEMQERKWMNPDDGFLVGEVRVAKEDNVLVLTDPTDTRWTIVPAESLDDASRTLLESGERVGIRGKVLEEEKSFLACVVRPLEFSGRGPRPMEKAPPQNLFERKNHGERNTECEDVRPLD